MSAAALVDFFPWIIQMDCNVFHRKIILNVKLLRKLYITVYLVDIMDVISVRRASKNCSDEYSEYWYCTVSWVFICRSINSMVQVQYNVVLILKYSTRVLYSNINGAACK